MGSIGDPISFQQLHWLELLLGAPGCDFSCNMVSILGIQWDGDTATGSSGTGSDRNECGRADGIVWCHVRLLCVQIWLWQVGTFILQFPLDLMELQVL